MQRDHNLEVVVMCSVSGQIQRINIGKRDTFNAIHAFSVCSKRSYTINTWSALGGSQKLLASMSTCGGKLRPVPHEMLALGPTSSTITRFHPTNIQLGFNPS